MAQIVFWILVGAWIALEIYLHIAHNPRVRQSNSEKLSKYVMLAAFLFGIFSGRLFFLAAYVVLRIVSVRQLGRSYSVNLGVRPDQTLVTTGLYGIVRHPGYASLIPGIL